MIFKKANNNNYKGGLSENEKERSIYSYFQSKKKL